MKEMPVSRRAFLKALLASGTGIVFARLGSARARDVQQVGGEPIYLPVMMKHDSRASLLGRVVQVHAPGVHNWDFNSAHYYGQTQAPGLPGVSQAVVDAMLDRGVTALLGLPLASLAEAWRQLLPGYVSGKLVAIKINLNNSSTCNAGSAAIDAIAQPVNSVVRSLKLIGVRDEDIAVYDAQRSIPQRLFDAMAYKNIRYYDLSNCRAYPVSFNSSDPHAVLEFHPPSGSIATTRLTDLLVSASYLINMPIIKGHSLAGVTLGFKNHFGSTNGPDHMHNYVSTSYAQLETYDALVDLYSNPHIRDKTVLTIGDGIYGSRGVQNSNPAPWTIFGSQTPCSLFLATDPVAVDCVMYDLLKAERGASQADNSNAYLRLASQAGLGVFERGDPLQTPYGSGYSKLDYQRIEM